MASRRWSPSRVARRSASRRWPSTWSSSPSGNSECRRSKWRSMACSSVSPVSGKWPTASSACWNAVADSR